MADPSDQIKELLLVFNASFPPATELAVARLPVADLTELDNPPRMTQLTGAVAAETLLEELMLPFVPPKMTEDSA